MPVPVQRVLLDRMFHRDLSNPRHKTNIDLHYEVTRSHDGKSVFEHSPSDCSMIKPKDPSVHKSITLGQYMTKKLRWMTLGGQYDWTHKIYPDEKPPIFPEDIKNLLLGLFPDTNPEAAIVNLYSPGDTLSLHRDVSEESERGLVSLSIGCDCIFILGLMDEEDDDTVKHLVLRLRSGDVVYMTGRSRFAWHGVPSIIPNTCPEALQCWPSSSDPQCTSGDSTSYPEWAGWMSTKRVNLNVRQMRV